MSTIELFLDRSKHYAERARKVYGHDRDEFERLMAEAEHWMELAELVTRVTLCHEEEPS